LDHVIAYGEVDWWHNLISLDTLSKSEGNISAYIMLVDYHSSHFRSGSE